MEFNALIIENNENHLDLLKQALMDVGVVCYTFSDGESAINSDNSIEYSFIIVSNNIKNMNSDLFLHQFRNRHDVSNTQVVFLYSDGDDNVTENSATVRSRLIFSAADLDSIKKYILNIINNRTLDLQGDILYIEDQEVEATVTMSLFKNYGVQIKHVYTVGEAKKAFIENQYDLVITDYYLANNETGDEIITFVRKCQDAEKMNTPILVVTGEADQNKRITFLRNGASDFIVKPYNNDEIIVRSSNLIQTRKLLQKLRYQQIELSRLAMTDQLTGLYNRHSLFDIAPKYLSEARRHEFPVSLLVVDLDYFKKVNDTHGHCVGDMVLKVVGKVLNDNCRKEDFVARFGGEEFVMLLSHCNLDFAATKAESLRLAIEKSKPDGLTVTASIGIAALSKDDNFDSLFEKADRAVYEAKESGRNKVVVHPDKFDNLV